jgi:2-polyprenyl-6-methoxyphenol hydroxylase-like FAD-dependent oxidoreductase
MSRAERHAIVLGGSMAGLAAAATLARRFERVTIVERDRLPAVGQHRKGVPQGRHLHALLPSGLEALTALLPGLTTDLIAGGAQVLDPQQFRLHLGGGRILPVDYGRDVIDATRPLVEGIVRERVRELGRVRFVEGCDVRGLTTTADRTRVTGVRLLSRTDSSVEECLPAELVVDATGRGSRTPRWLTELGYEAPEEQTIRVDVHYVTRLFQHRPGDLGDAMQILIGRTPAERRGGAAQVVEGHRWQVTLAGFLGERPPTDLEGFSSYARSLWCPDLHEVVVGAEPIGEAHTASYPANVRRRYDRLRRFPGGYLVLGDALCSFNPVYGQGMSVAALEAVRLGEVLDEVGMDTQGLQRIGPRFFRRSRRIVDVAWALATDADLADPAVEGQRGPRWKLLNAYLDRLLPVAHRDPEVALAFLQVIGLIAPPEQLVRPSIVRRVYARQRTVEPAAPAATTPVTAATTRRTLGR